MKIINLTQHPASAEQREAGVFDVPADLTYGGDTLREQLTFNELPAYDDVLLVAECIANLAKDNFECDAAMIGGAPFLMAPLVDALQRNGIKPMFAFSKRESVEETQPDGSVRKTAVFSHLGFVEAAR